MRNQENSEADRSFACSILADFAADRPDFLADLLMDADPRQFAVLFPQAAGQPDQVAAVLHGELGKRLTPQWHDPPLAPSWKQPDADDIRKIEAAKGMLAERFAFCQTMPLDDCLALTEKLRPCGYRPVRFRPFAAGGAVQVAALWERDGRRLAFGPRPDRTGGQPHGMPPSVKRA